MSDLANQPAFPHFIPTKCEDGTDDFEPKTGMTLRQYYAGLAMQALAGSAFGNCLPEDARLSAVAIAATRYSDALLAELQKPA